MASLINHLAKSRPTERAPIWDHAPSRTRPHVANIEKDYPKIREAALEEKQNLQINEWVDEKVEATFIQIDPMFLDCEQIQKWLKR